CHPVQPSTLVDVLRRRAADAPHREAFRFLPDGDPPGIGLTYAELDRRSQAVAAVLQHTARRGDRVLVLYPPGLGYGAAFFGCLYAGLVAVPAYPPRPKRPMPRLEAIVRDAQAMVALAAADVVDNLDPQHGLRSLVWISDVPAGAESDWRETTPQPD